MGNSPSPSVIGASVAATRRDGATHLAISVVIATHLGEERIGRCLEHLLNQTLEPQLFELVIVQNGPPTSTGAIVETLHDRYPHHAIRLIETAQAGVGHARNLGIDAAMGTYVTFVDDDDWVSPQFLAGLLAAATPGVIPVSRVADVMIKRDGTLGEPDRDNYIENKLSRYVRQRVSALKIPQALGFNAGKLVRTDIARAVRYLEHLRSGEDVLFWSAVYQRHRAKIWVCDDDVVYYRTVREQSVSRQAPSYDFNVTQRLVSIKALMDLSTSAGPRAQRLIRWMENAQATHIRAFLDIYPEREVDLRRDATEIGISDWMSWSAINADRADHLAVLYLFPPFLDTSALVAARRIRERGVITDVLSRNVSRLRGRDPDSVRIASPYLDQLQVLGDADSGGDWSTWRDTRRFAQDVLSTYRSMKKTRTRRYRSIYSRAMAPQSHFAAAAIKIDEPELRWIAEFSDPMLIDTRGKERRGTVRNDRLARRLLSGIAATGFAPPPTRQLYLWAEMIPYALADELVFTNSHQRDMMLGYCPDEALAERAYSVSRISPQPIPPSDLYHAVEANCAFPLDPGLVHIGYFGAFYVTRGLTEVVDAIEALEPQARQRIMLHVFTPNAEVLAEDVVERGLVDAIAVWNLVPYLEFLNLTTRFDVLLVNDARTSDHHDLNPYLPSKLSDYVGSGTPIWSIIEAGSVLSGAPTTYRSELGDSVSAARVLRQIIADADDVATPVDAWAFIDSYGD